MAVVKRRVASTDFPIGVVSLRGGGGAVTEITNFRATPDINFSFSADPSLKDKVRKGRPFLLYQSIRSAEEFWVEFP